MSHGLLAALMRSGEPSRRIAELLLKDSPMELSDDAFQESIHLLLRNFHREWLDVNSEVLVDPGHVIANRWVFIRPPLRSFAIAPAP